jgi:hypothetical protein
MSVENQVNASEYPLTSKIFGDSIHAAEMFSLPGELTAYSYRAPAKQLSPETCEAIYAALVPVTTRSFGADMTSYWSYRKTNGYFAKLQEFTVIADTTGQMVGWTGYSVLRADDFVNFYIDSTGMVPSRQFRGVMRHVLRRRLGKAYSEHRGTTPLILASARSESPIVYKLMKKVLGGDHVFPCVGGDVPADILNHGKHLAAWLEQTDILERDSLILRNAYTMVDELYDELPSTGDPDLDRMFREKLGPLDAYLLIGVMSDVILGD